MGLGISSENWGHSHIKSQRNRMKKSKYPEVRRVLRQAWLEVKESNPSVSLNAINEVTKISRTTLNAWFKGARAPQETKIDALAAYFFKGQDSAAKARRDKFIADLEEASKIHVEDTESSPLYRILNPPSTLKVGVIDYGPFAGEKGEDTPFFDSLFKHFAAYAGLKTDLLHIEYLEAPLSTVQDKLYKTQELDIVLSILATPDRSLRMSFFKFPIQIPVNAVVRQDHLYKYKIRDVRDTLLKFRSQAEDPSTILSPIVNEGEVGGLHVTNYLQMSSDDCQLVDYRIADYVKELEKPQIGSKVPIVVADELCCAQVVLEWHKRTAKNKKPKSLPEVELVFQQHSGAAMMPRYPLGFAVSRKHRDFVDYLTTAFQLFVESNVELVAHLYFKLAKNLIYDLADVYKTVLGSDHPYVCGPAEWLGLSPYLNAKALNDDAAKDDKIENATKSHRLANTSTALATRDTLTEWIIRRIERTDPWHHILNQTTNELYPDLVKLTQQRNT